MDPVKPTGLKEKNNDSCISVIHYVNQPTVSRCFFLSLSLSLL